MHDAKGLRRLVAVLVSMVAACTASAASLLGSPPYVSYTTALNVYPQNFAITQDSRGIVYVGNSNGVLEFDGERWLLIALDNREVVRSLAVANDDRIYVGGYNAFGYLERDVAGRPRFVDLTLLFRTALGGREFADIWDTLVTPDGVYFRALRDVFFWDSARNITRHWHHEQRFGAIIHHNGETLLQFRGQGLKRRQGETWSLLPETNQLVELIFQLLPVSDGGLLAMGVKGDWLLLKNGAVVPASMPSGLPASSNFQAAAVLDDGSIALAGGNGMLYIVDPSRRFERHFKIDPGFLSHVHPTIDGGFLVSGNQSVYRVAWPTSWSVLGTEHGADGSLKRLRRWNGVDYLLSSAGTFKVVPGEGGIARFEPVQWSDDSAYDLIEIDNRRALLATAHKLMRVEDDATSQVSDELLYPRMFQQSIYRNDRIYIGTENGLRYAQLRGAELELSPLSNQGLEMRVSSLAELSPRELWFGTERHGVWRVRLNELGAVVEQKRFGIADGLQLGIVPGAMVERLTNDALIVSTHAGIFRLVGERFVADNLFGLATLRSQEELLTIAQAANGDLWAYGVGRLFLRPSSGEWAEQSVSGIRRGALETHMFPDPGRAVFVASQSLLFYDGAVPPSRAPSPSVSLRSVELIRPDGRREPLPLNGQLPMHLQYGDFGVNFQFALPDLPHPQARSYQARLVGYEGEFSAWSTTRGYTYSRISPGHYSLQVRARDGRGSISEIVPYNLIIDPPWYRTRWAYVAVFVVGSVAVWWLMRLTVRLRTRRLADDKRRLESTVADRTRDLAQANRRLEAMAHLDGLTAIANRRRLDEYLSEVWERARESKLAVAVLAIDVDHFKRYNDTHGHLAGDQLLKDLVPRLSQCLRHSEDLLARYGGEEFVAVLPGADAAVAAAIADAMRRDIDNAQLGATISIGVASWIAVTDDVSTLVKAADLALYEAKHLGRNRISLSVSTGPS